MHTLRTGYSQEWRHSGGSELDKDQGGLLAQRLNRREADGIGSWMGSGRLKERVSLWWCTGWGFGGQAQMGENFDNHRGLFDGGDMRHQATTLETNGHVDREHD